MESQPCSVARLMSAILDKPLEEMFPAAGLKLCPWCDQASMKAEYYPFCNNSCLFQFNTQKVPLECSECGEVVLITKNQMMLRASRTTSGRMYCSKTCQGKWLARSHGFGTRPQDIGGKAKKWGSQCKNGHPWTQENVGVSGKSRYCKVCNLDANRRSRQKRNDGKG